ncbi:hypothetical protein PSY80_24415, partial [Shigella flexneri]|nr:hypothetical protein [Shigella flexneri]
EKIVISRTEEAVRRVTQIDQESGEELGRITATNPPNSSPDSWSICVTLLTAFSVLEKIVISRTEEAVRRVTQIDQESGEE